MSVIDDWTAPMVPRPPLADRAQYALAETDRICRDIWGDDPAAWIPTQRIAYEQAVAEILAAYEAERAAATGATS